MPTQSPTEVGNTLLVGAIGTALPTIVSNWVTIVVGILTGVWITIQIIDKLRKWNK